MFLNSMENICFIVDMDPANIDYIVHQVSFPIEANYKII